MSIKSMPEKFHNNMQNFIKISNHCFLFQGGWLNNNSIVLFGNNTIFIIDPSYNFQKIKTFLAAYQMKKVVIYTHVHADHIGDEFHETIAYADKVIFSQSVEKLISQKYFNQMFFGKIKSIDASELAKMHFVNNFDKFEECTFYLTPGHSIDSMCIIFKTFLLTGDTVFSDGLGRTDFILSDPQIMQVSVKFIKQIMNENLSFMVIPGHDAYDTAANILKHNPYLR